VMEILTEAAGRHGRILKDPEPYAVFQDFGDSALIFDLFFWIHIGNGSPPAVIASDLRLMIDKRFNEAKISVPFPQRDLRLSVGSPIPVSISSAVETATSDA
jgi:potassium-dependent mechanosensitive channel